jgi:hypothetical protein
LELGLDQSLTAFKTSLITTDILGKTVMAGEYFENPDGSSLMIDTDYFGVKRERSSPTIGPFENPGSGKLRLKVW